eukprot:TRINITY_DN10479_c0_g1_i1.p1 TRINITY_DN10479_c0_g1~~TRINITY_DN10479_c0_g1_i1.p1  ORF type:complete len:1509 (-),score=294.82 TRINITY_DN10479_c0_g1_i1:98-4624(-)
MSNRPGHWRSASPPPLPRGPRAASAARTGRLCGSSGDSRQVRRVVLRRPSESARDAWDDGCDRSLVPAVPQRRRAVILKSAATVHQAARRSDSRGRAYSGDGAENDARCSNGRVSEGGQGRDGSDSWSDCERRDWLDSAEPNERRSKEIGSNDERFEPASTGRRVVITSGDGGRDRDGGGGDDVPLHNADLYSYEYDEVEVEEVEDDHAAAGQAVGRILRSREREKEAASQRRWNDGEEHTQRGHIDGEVRGKVHLDHGRQNDEHVRGRQENESARDDQHHRRQVDDVKLRRRDARHEDMSRTSIERSRHEIHDDRLHQDENHRNDQHDRRGRDAVKGRCREEISGVVGDGGGGGGNRDDGVRDGRLREGRDGHRQHDSRAGKDERRERDPREIENSRGRDREVTDRDDIGGVRRNSEGLGRDKADARPDLKRPWGGDKRHRSEDDRQRQNGHDRDNEAVSDAQISRGCHDGRRDHREAHDKDDNKHIAHASNQGRGRTDGRSQERPSRNTNDPRDDRRQGRRSEERCARASFEGERNVKSQRDDPTGVRDRSQRRGSSGDGRSSARRITDECGMSARKDGERPPLERCSDARGAHQHGPSTGDATQLSRSTQRGAHVLAEASRGARDQDGRLDDERGRKGRHEEKGRGDGRGAGGRANEDRGTKAPHSEARVDLSRDEHGRVEGRDGRDNGRGNERCHGRRGSFAEGDKGERGDPRERARHARRHDGRPHAEAGGDRESVGGRDDGGARRSFDDRRDGDRRYQCSSGGCASGGGGGGCRDAVVQRLGTETRLCSQVQGARRERGDGKAEPPRGRSARHFRERSRSRRRGDGDQRLAEAAGRGGSRGGRRATETRGGDRGVVGNRHRGSQIKGGGRRWVYVPKLPLEVKNWHWFESKQTGVVNVRFSGVFNAPDRWCIVELIGEKEAMELTKFLQSLGMRPHQQSHSEVPSAAELQRAVAAAVAAAAAEVVPALAANAAAAQSAACGSSAGSGAATAAKRPPVSTAGGGDGGGCGVESADLHEASSLAAKACVETVPASGVGATAKAAVTGESPVACDSLMPPSCDRSVGGGGGDAAGGGAVFAFGTTAPASSALGAGVAFGGIAAAGGGDEAGGVVTPAVAGSSKAALAQHMSTELTTHSPVAPAEAPLVPLSTLLRPPEVVPQDTLGAMKLSGNVDAAMPLLNVDVGVTAGIASVASHPVAPTFAAVDDRWVLVKNMPADVERKPLQWLSKKCNHCGIMPPVCSVPCAGGADDSHGTLLEMPCAEAATLLIAQIEAWKIGIPRMRAQLALKAQVEAESFSWVVVRDFPPEVKDDTFFKQKHEKVLRVNICRETQTSDRFALIELSSTDAAAELCASLNGPQRHGVMLAMKVTKALHDLMLQEADEKEFLGSQSTNPPSGDRARLGDEAGVRRQRRRSLSSASHRRRRHRSSELGREGGRGGIRGHRSKSRSRSRGGTRRAPLVRTAPSGIGGQRGGFARGPQASASYVPPVRTRRERSWTLTRPGT